MSEPTKYKKEVGTHSCCSSTRAEICAGIDPSIEIFSRFLKQIRLENHV
jgi:hypothetical protein